MRSRLSGWYLFHRLKLAQTSWRHSHLVWGSNQVSMSPTGQAAADQNTLMCTVVCPCYGCNVPPGPKKTGTTYSTGANFSNVSPHTVGGNFSTVSVCAKNTKFFVLYLPLTNTKLSPPPFLSLVIFISTLSPLIFHDFSTYFLGMSDNLALILGSGITVTFYWRKPGTVPFLYKLMGLFDVLVGLNAIYFVLLALTVLEDCSTEDYQLRESNSTLTIGIHSASEVNNSNCVNNIPAHYIGYMGTVVVTRVPLFAAMVMSIVRTINIATPFTRVRKLWIGLLILAWTLAWTGVAAYAGSVPIYHSGYHYLSDKGDVFIVDPFYRMITNNPSFTRDYSLITGQFLYSHLAGFIFPLSAILITTAIQVFLLWKSSGLTDSDSLQTQVSTTVIILAVVSLVIGLPNAIYISMGWSKYEASGSVYILDRLQLFVYGFVFPVLNSASDPVILVARGSKVREFIRSKGREVSTSSGMRNSSKVLTNMTTAAETQL
eukprot:sb/3464200/